MLRRRSDRWFWVVALLLLALSAIQIGSSLERVEGLVLGDEGEYLLMAESLRSDANPPVLPKRPWGLPLLQAPLLQMVDEEPSSEFDPGRARAISVLALLLAALGAGALAWHAAGRWAGLFSFGLVALQPELGFWSVTFLTDVPFCALAVIAIALWNRGRPLAAGVAMSSGLLFRYPGVIFIAAFVLVAAGQRRWRELARFLCGSLLPLALLGISDAFLWDTPFESVIAFTRDQAATFVPTWLMEVPGEAAADPARDLVLSAPRQWYSRSGSWYLTQLPGALTWPGLALLLAWPLLRRGLARRREIDLAFWCALVYLAALSVLEAKEVRYLVAALPLVAAVGGAGCARLVQWAGRPAGLVGRGGVASVAAFGLALLMLGAYARSSWMILRDRPHQPNGAVVDALSGIDALPEGSDNIRELGLDSPYCLLSHVQIQGYWNQAWVGPRRSLVHAPQLFADLAANEPTSPAALDARLLLERVDWWILPRAWDYEVAPELWQWINRRCVLDRVYYDSEENEYPIQSFRPAPDRGMAHSLWEVGPAVDEPALARFTGGLELRRVELSRPMPDSKQARVDYHWFIPPEFEGGALVRASFERRHADASTPPESRARDVFQLLPVNGALREQRMGAVVRETRYMLLPLEPLHVLLELAPDSWGGELTVESTSLEQPGSNSVASPLAD